MVDRTQAALRRVLATPATVALPRLPARAAEQHRPTDRHPAAGARCVVCPLRVGRLEKCVEGDWDKTEGSFKGFGRGVACRDGDAAESTGG